MDLQIRLPATTLFTDASTFQAAHAAFGIPIPDLRYATKNGIDLQVKCTDAQFGQFIAKRVVGGCPNNQIQILNVRILGESPRPAQVPAFNPNFDVR